MKKKLKIIFMPLHILHVLIASFLPSIAVSILLQPSSVAVIFFCGNQSETPCTRKYVIRIL
jgi:hypothetical protein